MVRGPPEGHRRTEGGRSSPAPGYLLKELGVLNQL